MALAGESHKYLTSWSCFLSVYVFPACAGVGREGRGLAELPLQELHDRLLLLGFVLESINKLGHASSVSKNYCWKSSFPVADTLYGLHGKCSFKLPYNSSCMACWDFACLYRTVGEKSSDKVPEGFAVLCKKLLVIFLSCCLSWPNIFQRVLRRKKFEVISHDYSREIWWLSPLPLKLVQRLKTPRSATSLVLSIPLHFLWVCVFSRSKQNKVHRSQG